MQKKYGKADEAVLFLVGHLNHFLALSSEYILFVASMKTQPFAIYVVVIKRTAKGVWDSKVQCNIVYVI